MKIVVYGAPGCIQCRSTNKWLTDRSIAFEKIDISVDTDAAEELRAQGLMSLPVVKADNDVWTGFRPDLLKNLVVTQ